MDERSNKSAEIVAETRCDARRQIVEIEDEVFAKFEKAGETRRSICLPSSDILAEEKEKVAELRRLASKIWLIIWQIWKKSMHR